MQEFIYTGPWPVSYRVATLFGKAIWSWRVEASHERRALRGPDVFADGATGGGMSIVSTGQGCRFELNCEPDVIALAEQAHGAFAEIPLLGVDIIREQPSGKLYVIEANSCGRTWHFSGTKGRAIQRQFGFDLGPDPVHPGTPILHVGMFSRGKGLFSPVQYIPPAEEPDADYPLLLTTGRILYHYHTGTMSRRVDSLDAHRPDGFVEMNPEDARALGLSHGDIAVVASRRGTVKARCEVTRRARPGTVFMAFHFAEAAANLLTNDAFDPIAKIPEFKVAACQIEKINQ